ncbi:hypothetical protein LOAG_08103 [Loa loa]|uniref:Uncharacterized protein n=1 Tax=Loa loa TaxID=7209 RepID=A0A1S0TV54_LOALO|nr:hypothetical protein LOAG_08103 [Loa loa]EFO20389.1 hypothetical protein LOAG_08103 [Loa loa]
MTPGEGNKCMEIYKAAGKFMGPELAIFYVPPPPHLPLEYPEDEQLGQLLAHDRITEKRNAGKVV